MNSPKPCQKLIFTFLSAVLLFPLFSSPQLVYSQEDTNQPSTTGTTTVTGGNDFETAEELTVGSYEGGKVDSETSKYFKVSGVKPGEGLVITGDFEGDSSADVTLYSSDREDLAHDTQYADDAKALELYWLPGSEEASYTYYIELEAGYGDGLLSYSLDIEKVNLFDAGTERDAGDSADNAIPLSAGSYTGYISGRYGSDEKDFYGFDLQRGQVLIATVTPPSDRSLEAVHFYDSSREHLSRTGWPNAGAVVEVPFLVEETGTYFMEIEQTLPGEYEPIEYDFDIEIKPLSEAREYFEEDEVPIEIGTGESVDDDDDTAIPASQDVVKREAEGLLAQVTQGINTVLVGVVGVVALLIGFALGFFTAKLLSGGKKKEEKASQVDSSEPQE